MPCKFLAKNSIFTYNITSSDIFEDLTHRLIYCIVSLLHLQAPKTTYIGGEGACLNMSFLSKAKRVLRGGFRLADSCYVLDFLKLFSETHVCVCVCLRLHVLNMSVHSHASHEVGKYFMLKEAST